MSSNTLLEKASDIVIAHATSNTMTTPELLSEIRQVYNTLRELDGAAKPLPGAEAEAAAPAVSEAPEHRREAISLDKAFQRDQVICMICGKGNMRTLTRHLGQAHNMTPKAYKKEFNIPKDWPLTAVELTETRRQMAVDRGLATNLARARKARSTKTGPAKQAMQHAAEPAQQAQAPEQATEPTKAQVVKPAKAASKATSASKGVPKTGKGSGRPGRPRKDATAATQTKTKATKSAARSAGKETPTKAQGATAEKAAKGSSVKSNGNGHGKEAGATGKAKTTAKSRAAKTPAAPKHQARRPHAKGSKAPKGAIGKA